MPSYQVVSCNMYRHVCLLTTAGEFRNRQAARTVLVWFAMNISVTTAPDRGLHAGEVMRGCVGQGVIARNTGLSQSAISKAITWLTAQGFISVTYRFRGDRQYTHGVILESFDTQSEADRRAKLSQRGDS